MDITFLGHSSFKIRSKQATLITDPFDPEMVGLKFPKTSADIVTISHDHQDHSRSDLVDDVKKVISGPGEYEVLGVSILGFPTFHDDQKGKERGKNTVYVFETEGVRIAHLGDLGHKLSDVQVSQLGEINVLMVPVGGEYTIGPKDAVEAVKSISPSFIIPMHFQDEGLKKESFGSLLPVEDFLSADGLEKENTSKLKINESMFSEEFQKVILFDKKSG